MSLKKVFQRKEDKYLLTQEQFLAFQTELKQQMQVDTYGLHTIMSLYYDTADYRFIKSSMEKPKYKEKFRVRSYGTPNTEAEVFLEMKKKIERIVYKRRVAMPYPEYEVWQKGQHHVANQENPQIAAEINWLFKNHQDLHPKVLIAYDRLSFFCEDNPEFRVTFDQNIRYRTTNLRLAAGSEGDLVAPEIGVLMEVKALAAYPIWFVELLNQHQLRKGSFSKYAQTYQRYLHHREEENHVYQCL
ncbi:MAG: polyphosphate polymerase domain-containing protein [Enterococcus sp.]